MTLLMIVAAALSASGAHARLTRDYPSCDLPAQRTLVGTTGGPIRDRLQAHVSARVNVLLADIGNARKARRLSQRAAIALSKRANDVRRGSDGYARDQGFLSAGELASYDRELDAIATRLCR